MATCTGPLMSMVASGKFGGAITFDKRGYARVYKIPANPQTVPQANARQYLADAQAALKIVGLVPLAAMKAASPTGYRWNSNMIKLMIGPAQVYAEDAHTTYDLLTDPNRAAWDAAFADVVVGTVPGVPTVLKSKGFCGWLLATALYRESIVTSPGAPIGTNSATWVAAIIADA